MDDRLKIKSKYRSTCKSLGVLVLILGLLGDAFYALQIFGPFFSHGGRMNSFALGADLLFKLRILIIAVLLTCVLPTIMFAIAENLEFSERISRQLVYYNQITDQNAPYGWNPSPQAVQNNEANSSGAPESNN